MEISQLISEELILFDDSIRSKKSLFECIGTTLETTHRVKSAKKIIKALFKREEEVPTGIEAGFGIPHAKSKAVITPTICFVRSSQITGYLGLDGEPIAYTFAIVVPANAADSHLEILSALSRRLIDPNFRKQIKEANSASEIMTVLKNEEKAIR